MQQPPKRRSDASSARRPSPGENLERTLTSSGLGSSRVGSTSSVSQSLDDRRARILPSRGAERSANHYIRGGATFQLALGAGDLVAARRRDWRLPVLMMLTLQFVLHAINHLNDSANPRWLGVANFVALAASAALVGWLLRRASARTMGQPQ